MKLNLGCGYEIKAGFINVDYLHKTDMTHEPKILKWDLNKYPYPFKDNSAEYIELSKILRHLKEPIKCLKECHRILRKDGLININMTHFTNAESWVPEHITYWNSFYIDQLCNDGKVKRNNMDVHNWFRVKKREIQFYKGFAFWNHIIEPIVNINDYTRRAYENFFCYIFPAKNIHIILKKGGKELASGFLSHFRIL